MPARSPTFIGTRLDKEEVKRLDALAEHLQGNRSQTVRFLVVEGLARHKTELAQEE